MGIGVGVVVEINLLGKPVKILLSMFQHPEYVWRGRCNEDIQSWAGRYYQNNTRPTQLTRTSQTPNCFSRTPVRPCVSEWVCTILRVSGCGWVAEQQAQTKQQQTNYLTR